MECGSGVQVSVVMSVMVACRDVSSSAAGMGEFHPEARATMQLENRFEGGLPVRTSVTGRKSAVTISCAAMVSILKFRRDNIRAGGRVGVRPGSG